MFIFLFFLSCLSGICYFVGQTNNKNIANGSVEGRVIYGAFALLVFTYSKYCYLNLNTGLSFEFQFTFSLASSALL